MVASTEPRQMLTARCIWLARAALTAPIDSGVATSSAMRMPPSGGGGLERLQEIIDRRPELLDEIDDRRHVGDQHDDRTPQRGLFDMRPRVRLGSLIKVFVIAACLKKQRTECRG